MRKRAKCLWNMIPSQIRERPFDFYLAVVLLIVSCMNIRSSENLPLYITKYLPSLLVDIISMYFIFACLILLISMILSNKNFPHFCFFAEMWSWAAITAASLSAFVVYIHILIIGNVQEFNYWFWGMLMYFLLSFSSFIRSLGMWLIYKKLTNHYKRVE